MHCSKPTSWTGRLPQGCVCSFAPHSGSARVFGTCRVPLKNVELENNGKWSPLRRDVSNSWNYNGGFYKFPMHLRLTSVLDDVVEDWISSSTGGQGKSQFAELTPNSAAAAAGALPLTPDYPGGLSAPQPASFAPAVCLPSLSGLPGCVVCVVSLASLCPSWCEPICLSVWHPCVPSLCVCHPCLCVWHPCVLVSLSPCAPMCLCLCMYICKDKELQLNPAVHVSMLTLHI